MNTYTYFAQAIVDIKTREIRKYELLLRCWDAQKREWYLPDTFNISVGMQTRMLKNALDGLKIKKVSINLTVEQFANPNVMKRLTRFNAETTELTELTVELTTAPTVAQAQEMSPQYHAHNITIALDDVGTDIDDIALAEQLTPYVDIFKYALQNLRDEGITDGYLERMQPWANLAHAHNLQFNVEGIETYTDLEMARKVGANRAQGFFFNRPASPQPNSRADLAKRISNLDDLI